MVNEWLSEAKKSRLEPFSERTVIEPPRCGRIPPPNSSWVDNTGFYNRNYLEEDVNRRSLVMSLFGGLAAASLGGTAFAAARQPGLAPAMPAGDQIDAATKAALDATDADFNQVSVRIGPRRRRRRPVIVRRRVIVRRPRRVVRRRVIVR